MKYNNPTKCYDRYNDKKCSSWSQSMETKPFLESDDLQTSCFCAESGTAPPAGRGSTAAHKAPLSHRPPTHPPIPFPQSTQTPISWIPTAHPLRKPRITGTIRNRDAIRCGYEHLEPPQRLWGILPPTESSGIETDLMINQPNNGSVRFAPRHLFSVWFGREHSPSSVDTSSLVTEMKNALQLLQRSMHPLNQNGIVIRTWREIDEEKWLLRVLGNNWNQIWIKSYSQSTIGTRSCCRFGVGAVLRKKYVALERHVSSFAKIKFEKSKTAIPWEQNELATPSPYQSFSWIP